MAVEQALLIVLTVAVVLLITIAITALVVIWQTVRRFRQAAEDMQRITEKSASAAERFAPLGIAVVSMFQVVRMVRKFRR